MQIIFNRIEQTLFKGMSISVAWRIFSLHCVQKYGYRFVAMAILQMTILEGRQSVSYNWLT